MTHTVQREKCFLGIDVGTTTIKAVICDRNARVLAQANRHCPTISPDLGRHEQEARLWQLYSVEVVRSALKDLPSGYSVVALSLSTQGGTMVPLNADFQPLRNAVLWKDASCAEDLAMIESILPPGYVYQQTGWSPYRGLNLLQIMRLRRENPDLFNATRYFASVPDYMNYYLCGRFAADYSNAGINQLGDVVNKVWDNKLLQQAGVTVKQLPELVDSGTALGTLTPQAAEDLGLSTDVQVVAGGHDQNCVALGCGAILPGSTSIGSGTAWVVLAVTEDQERLSKGGFSFSRHVIDDTWTSMISLSTGGTYLEWWRNRLVAAPELPPFDLIDAQVEDSLDLADELLFVPNSRYSFTGAHNLPQGATFLGLDEKHQAYDLARAIMEGVAFQALLNLQRLNNGWPERITFTGGATKSPIWPDIVAAAADRPLILPEVKDSGAYGAALLAGIGTGYFNNLEELSDMLIRRGTVIEPQPDRWTNTVRRFALYREINN
ncbi:MAG: hypothetical protein GX900_05780 [Clostridiaceae bacterium]|nr:hypothetical protein [Clostridiaceae bacterium]